MFPSISRALPNTPQVTQFVATKQIIIATQSTIAFAINSIPNNNSSITVQAGDVVSATITSPQNHLEHAFFEYTIDGIPQNFAVVNVSQYTIRLNPAHADKRWYNYTSSTQDLTLRTLTGDFVQLTLYNRLLNVNFDFHVILDILTTAAYFISPAGVITAKISFTNAPIGYQILKNLNLALVVTAAGELYTIDQSGATTLLPALPSATAICISYDGSRYIWAAGDGWAWKLDATNNFSLVATVAVTNKVLGIAACPGGSAAIAATDTSKLYLLEATGVTDLNHIGVGLGQPICFNNKIYIPDSSNEQILVYDCISDALVTPIATPGFSPSYTFVHSTNLYVCGNDSPDVLVFDQTLTLTSTILFFDKITWISVAFDTIIASRWLTNYQLTLAPNLERIVNVKFNKRYGPITHIGSDVIVIKQLGSTVTGAVNGYTAARTTLWVNGTKSSSQSVRGVELIDDDNVNISYRSTVPGTSQIACVIGDTAYDYQITSFVETYIPRYIDFPLGTTINPVYTLNIEMPSQMTPCTMAIEYGTLYLDGALYDGSYYVQASSLITISIPIGRPQNFGLGTVPIFTLGGRQFAVPISSFVNAAFAIIVDDQLIPGTLIKKTQVISGQAALYDFILPNYYDIDISQQRPNENAKSVVGDYYHSFGVGDILSVEFKSSSKLYDTEAVYILGPTNYKFIAENSPPFLINTLTYDPVIAPYTRSIDQILEGSVEITGGGAQNYIPGTQFTPTIQFTTPTYPVTTSAAINSGSLEFLQASDNYLHYQNSLFQAIGNFTIEFWARPSLAGVSSAQCFMLVMGVEAIGQMGIYLDNGIPTLFLYDTAANVTARTPVILQPVQSSQPVLPGPSLVQNTWHHIAVSRNGAILQFFIDGIKTTDNISYSTVIGNSDMYIGDSSQVRASYYNSKNWDGQLTDIRYVRGIAVYTNNFAPSTRPLTSNQAANINGTPSAAIALVTSTILLLGAHKDATYMVDGSSYSNTVIDLLQPAFSTETPYQASISSGAVLTTAGGDAYLIIDGIIAVGTDITITAPNGQTATIQNAVQVFLGDTIALARNVQSYYDGSITVVQNLVDIEGTLAEFVIAEWGIVNQILNGVVNTNQGTVIQSAATAIRYNENFNNVSNLIEFTVENALTVPSSTHEWYQATTMVPPSSTHEWYQATTMVPPSSTHEWYQATTMVPPSSTHEWYQATTMVPPSSTHEWYQATTMVPNSSTVEFIHETVFTPKSSTVEFIHETVFTPKSSTVEFIHDNVHELKSSTAEFIHETVFTPKSSTAEFIHETVFTPKSSTAEFIHETVVTPKSSTVEFIHDSVHELKSSTVEFIHDHVIEDKLNIAVKPIHRLLFDKHTNNKEIITYLLTKTSQINKYVPQVQVKQASLVLLDLNQYSHFKLNFNKFVLSDELPVHMDYNKFVLADELPVHMDYNKFVLADERRTPLDYNKFVLADELRTPLDYNKFVLADELRTPLDYDRFVLADELRTPLDYDRFVLADERRTPLDYDRFVLADERRTPLDYDRFVLADELRTPLDYDRFVGDTYTIVPLLYNRKIQEAGSLIFADIRREDMVNYIFLPMPITPTKYSPIVNDMVYNSSKPIAFREIYLEYKRAELLEETTVHLDYEPAPRSSGGTVKSVYEQDLSLPSASIKAVYEQDLSLPVASIKAVYEQDLSLSLVSAKGVYGSLSNKLYVSEKLVYEQEFGIVWDQQIDIDATLFLTAEEAETTAAADGYEFYRPYQIYDTNYYSYRVLVDTALVCKLPKGRYPIAWLLHGG